MEIVRPTKKQKQKQPLKVVYISNPMRVTTSAASFRTVVQKLTGRDSDIANILTRQPPFDSSPPPRLFEPCDTPHRPWPLGLAGDGGDDPLRLMAERFGGMDEYFSAGLLPPPLLFEPPQLGGGNK